MARAWKPTHEQVATVRRRTLDGDDIDSIAADLGMTRRTLASNKETALYFSKRGQPPRTFSDRERAKARHLAAAGWSHEKIARALDVSRETLEKHLGRILAEAASDRAAVASASIGAAAARGDWRCGVKILQAQESGTWRDSVKAEVDTSPAIECDRAKSARMEEMISKMTRDEREALRVVATAAARIADTSSLVEADVIGRR